MDQVLSEKQYRQTIESGETDPEVDYEHEVDLDNQMHAGVFAGSHRFTKCREHQCQTCGFQCSNSTYLPLSIVLDNVFETR